MCARNILLLPTIIIIFLAACGGSAEPTLLPPDEPEATAVATPSETGGRAPSGDTSDVITAALGLPFELRIGQRVRIDGLVITFVAISEDSRCPEGVQCIWAGRVKVSVRVQHNGEALGDYDLTEGAMREGDVGEIVVAGYLLRLLGVEPYPMVGAQIGDEEYLVEMVVVRAD